MAETGIFKIFLRLAILASTLQLIKAYYFPTTCLEALHRGHTESGIYNLDPEAKGDVLMVYCDQTTDGGGWTVFQRRQGGSVNFQRNWEEYRAGFGGPCGEHWLGNDNINWLISQRGHHELRIELEDFSGNKTYVKYSTFKVASANEKYLLTVSGFSGGVGDSLTYHSGSKFSTPDQDNDGTPTTDCAASYLSGWWFKTCAMSHLNGVYNTDPSVWLGRNIWWDEFQGLYPLKFTEMKFREVF